jgi:hypothetical protein
MPDVTVTALPDWGYLLLHHDGTGWVVGHQDGRVLWRNADVAAGEPTAARRWLAQLVVESAAVTPDGMGQAADMYGLQVLNGQLAADPVGGLGRDEHGWILVDGRGQIVERADGIDADDHTAANAWAERYYTSRAEGRRWRVNVGVFPDGSYGDFHGLLGRQRLRRAWNWTLDRLRI